MVRGGGGREERKGHNDTNDNYRIVNTRILNEVALPLVVDVARHPVYHHRRSS